MKNEFSVGDQVIRIRFPSVGIGIVEKVTSGDYPVKVRWGDDKFITYIEEGRQMKNHSVSIRKLTKLELALL